MKREAEIQDALKDLVEGLIAKKFRFSGVELTHVKRDHPIGSGREADLVLFMRGEVPFMFIETKRKEKGGARGLFDPLDVSVVGQVMSYAAIYKRDHNFIVPFVATANPDRIVVFKTPENIEDYIDMEAVLERDYRRAFKPRKFRYLLKDQMERAEKLGLNEEYIRVLLDRLAKSYVEKRAPKAEPGKALIGTFREFVDRVAERCMPLVESKVKGEPLRSEVEKLGYKLDSASLPSTAANLARMMSYVLMNKIIFYKILEGSFRLPPMVSLDSSSSTRFNEDLSRYFRRAIEVTGDFEPIFSTGVYDRLPIPDDPEVMEDIINEFIATIANVEIIELADQIGYMYEELIPPEERHQLGQFYTPPWVCDLITKWCIRGSDDVVMDPGVGSGGFLLKAYQKLKEEKIGDVPSSLVRKEVHERILNQLYALDINPFPAHLSAVGLAMRNVRVPSTKLNVIHADFFSLRPEQKVLAPYVVKTAAGELRREFIIPKMDAVIGNPPYTRWIEIPEETQGLIRKHLSKQMKEYGLTPRVSRGLQPGIYTYWIMHANSFLKEGGRLGMIISNTWLQTTYGIGFGNFLMDHFRIKAVVDLALKLFKGALITTCIVLAERESDEKKRLENKVAFIHIPGEVESAGVSGLLKAVETGSSKEYPVTLVKQKELPRNRKWIDIFFKTVDLSSHPLMAKLGDFFEPSGGNTTYSVLTSAKTRQIRGPGASEFHYLPFTKIKEYKLDKWSYPVASLEDALVYPAVINARQTIYFTFTEEDWEEQCKSDKRCYMFVSHRAREKLPKEVMEYIQWGETECRVKAKGRQLGGRGKLANETEGARIRAKEKKHFYGWYDLGGVIRTPLFAPRYGWCKTRFILCKFPIVMCDNHLALIPKKTIFFNESQIKALLGYLNSSFAQFYIERKGRKSPGGVIGLEIDIAREMPVLDVKKLNDKQVNSLAKLFDELERETRKIGGASTKEQIEKLKPKIYEIDRAVAKLLGLKDEDVKNVETQVDLMVERRVSVAR